LTVGTSHATIPYALAPAIRIAHPAKDAHPEQARRGGRVEGFFPSLDSIPSR